MLKKKKGFTLVELLAVIAILAVLVVIALPSVLDIFNESKEQAFVTQAQTIFKAAEQQYLLDQMGTSPKSSYCKSTFTGTETLKLSGGTNKLKYKVVFSNGYPTYIIVGDGAWSAVAGTEGGSTTVSAKDIKLQKNDTTINCS